MNIALIGPSGAGKGTYAHKLARDYSLRHVSTGDLLRTSIENKSPLGLLVTQYIETGDFVPDEFIDAIIEESLKNMDSGTGVLFDGFPRTVYQAESLQKILSESGRKLDAVVYLIASDEEIRRRLYGRLICRKCQFPHHIDHVDSMICQNGDCGGELFRRPDDKGDIPVARLQVYHRETAPLLAYYEKHGLLHSIDAERSIERVHHDLHDLFENLKNQPHATREITDFVPAKTVQGKLILKTVQEQNISVPDIVLLGAPGSGKGTQAKLLCDAFGVVQISTGDLFRKNIAQKTKLGKLAQFYIDRGELVPQEITESMVRQRIALDDTANGVILDGFPRTLPQAEALNQLMHELGRTIAAVVYIAVPDEDIIERLSARITCKMCNRPFIRISILFRNAQRLNAMGSIFTSARMIRQKQFVSV